MSLMNFYEKSIINFSYGEGSYLYTIEGEKYLDFATAVGVTALGASHKEINKIIKKQSSRLMIMGNAYNNDETKRAADMLAKFSRLASVFLCNSGAEANELAIKLIRNYHYKISGTNKRNRIICFYGAYHGRTIGTTSASDPKYRIDNFAPYLDGFDFAKFNDIKSVEKLIKDDTAGILLEPIQGQGGVRVATSEFLNELAKLCQTHGILLALDEVQCGIGRTGKLFNYQHYDFMPDIVTVAKALGNGYPVAACLANERVNETIECGSHGSTYGGNPLGAAIISKVLEIVSDPKMLEHIKIMGQILSAELMKIYQEYPQIIAEIRGMGLMLGIKLTDRVNIRNNIEKLREAKILTVRSADQTVRILPAYIIDRGHIEEATEKIRAVTKLFFRTLG